MKDYEIAQQRRESYLQELVGEALGNLNDELLSGLQVTYVKCSRGKHSAIVFIEATSIDDKDMQKILKSFNKAKTIIQEYIKSVSGWHNCPKLTLEFDKTLQTQNNLDRIFEMINAKKSK